MGTNKILRKIEYTLHSLGFTGKGKHRTMVGIIVEKNLKENVVGIID